MSKEEENGDDDDDDVDVVPQLVFDEFDLSGDDDEAGGAVREIIRPGEDAMFRPTKSNFIKSFESKLSKAKDADPDASFSDVFDFFLEAEGIAGETKLTQSIGVLDCMSALLLEFLSSIHSFIYSFILQLETPNRQMSKPSTTKYSKPSTTKYIHSSSLLKKIKT
jgi:hypothetical protein